MDPNLPYLPKRSNDVLEFLGDSFLGAVVAKYLVDRFNDQQEGSLTRTKTLLVQTNMLHRFARFLMLGSFILLSPQVEQFQHLGSQNGRNNARLYEDCFQAFIGAIINNFAVDDDPVAGSKYAYRFIINIIEYVVDFADLIVFNENFKDTLQRQGPSERKNSTKGLAVDGKKNAAEQIQKDGSAETSRAKQTRNMIRKVKILQDWEEISKTISSMITKESLRERFMEYDTISQYTLPQAIQDIGWKLH
ncbi:ribonuclease III domain-containing protein [Blyttiomyces helicus]|uniref:Ribonuclease III domain-containing protein n=1 Tax=Blyttiomyces helicus TaxID=388810 RepID=A0A4V1IS68_9FUNG|nr:ribonuclease III domain-containing protein [Blyttiomyces helicus]|eukprot:RKO92507.1 ribonuclease III domain-containing protein [Blyttiomyces helicus]